MLNISAAMAIADQPSQRSAPATLRRTRQFLPISLFLLAKKTGYTKRLMDHVHEGIMSPNGLASSMEHILRRLQNRYYQLFGIFSHGLARNFSENDNYVAPTPPSAAAYLKLNQLVAHGTLTEVWLKCTEQYGPLCERVMKQCVVKKVLHIDHSAKFCKKLKEWEAHGHRYNLSDAKLLLLVQNEIGQIILRRLTRSENREETEHLLSDVRTQLHPVGDCYLTSDNASTVRNMVQNVFGEAVLVKQDPFHVIERISRCIRHDSLRKWLSKQLSEVFYDVTRQLRAPTDVEVALRSLVSRITVHDLNCSEKEWNGCVESNLRQIARGDLHVDENVYKEADGPEIRIVSTSQLESFHSALKKLLSRDVRVELGLRILDVFIIRHNLAVGAAYGRNPAMGCVDLIAACRAAMICSQFSHNLVADSRDQAFVKDLLSTPLLPLQYRSATSHDSQFSSWQQLFLGVQVDTEALQSQVNKSRRHLNTIKELLFKNATNLQSGRVTHEEFMRSLQLDQDNRECNLGFSTEEFELLRQVVSEQKSCDRAWANCALTTCIMYNLVVSSNTNSHLKLRRRSFKTLAGKLKNPDGETRQAVKAQQTANLFTFRSQTQSNAQPSPNEQLFQFNLFELLRSSSSIKHKRQVFCGLLDFASCVCSDVRLFSNDAMVLRWEALKRSSNRQSVMKIRCNTNPAEISNAIYPVSVGAVAQSSADVVAETSTDVEAASVAVTQNAQEHAAPLDVPANHLTFLPASLCTPAETPTLLPGAISVPAADKSNPLLAPPSVHARPIKIADEHLKILLSESNKFKHSKGKAAHLMEIYEQWYTKGSMQNNMLRMRIRNYSRALEWQSQPLHASNQPPTTETAVPPVPIQNVASTNVQAPVPAADNLHSASMVTAAQDERSKKKRKITSCSDCTRKHKKCGELAINPSCMRVSQTQQPNTLDSYFIANE